MVPVMDKNIQINGIYQVLAKIKEVNMVNNHNCLLWAKYDLKAIITTLQIIFINRAEYFR